MRKLYLTLIRSASLFMLLLFATAAVAQQRIVSGTVSDADGNPMPGVNVVLKGTTSGTSTNANGQFSIEASPEDVLTVSFIGYITQEIKVGTQTQVNFHLQEDISTLEEVVVVGYGEMRRSDLTSAQTSVSSDQIQKTVNTTIEQAIQGRSAGVYVTQNTGAPGGGISVAIRGVNTISGNNEPLYVIDGVQIEGQSNTTGSNPLAGLNPADIEDIQILQGPSATAMYGSRATNGVVLITTKRGKAGEMKISYGYQYSIQAPPKRVKVMNLRQYAQMENEFHAIDGGESPESFLDPSLLGEGTDWQKELFHHTPMSKHQLSLSGGSDKTTYYISGEYLTQEGVAIGSQFDRYSFRLNLDNQPRKWLQFGANLSFNQTNDDLTSSQENVIANALRLTPQVPVRNIDGSWGGSEPQNGGTQYAPVNPVAIASLTTNELVRRQFLGGLNVTLNIAKGLTLRSSINTNLSFWTSNYYQPKYKFGYNENTIASLETRSGTNTSWNWNQLLEYNTQIGKHGITVMASHEAQVSDYRNVGGRRTGFLTNNILDLEAGDPTIGVTNSGGNGDWAMESYLGRVNYNFDDRYILMGTVRTDGSVNFGPENKWGVFPSLSAAWRISQESFFNVSFIDELKLRFETGLTGNQGGSGYIYSRLQSGATPTGTGFLPTRYANPGLQWEETLTNDIGINVAMLDHRVQFEFDYYVKKTDNLLMENPLPMYMGSNGQGAVGAPQVNIGALENRGWGFTINTTNINNGNFKWESNFNISHFKTKITRFYSESAHLDRTSWWMNDWTQRSVVGEAPWLFRGYIDDGLFQTVSEIENSALPVDNLQNELPINEENVWVGDIKFRDVSGPNGVPDGIIDDYDQTFIGNPWPRLFAGLTNTFSYKGFTLSVLLTGTYGNDIYNQVARVTSSPYNIYVSQNMQVSALNYARPIVNDEGQVVLANPETNVPRISNGPNDNFERHSSKWVEDGSFIRLKNVSLSYDLPKSLISKQNVIRGARISVGAQNLVTLTRYSGFDPEVGAYVGRDANAANQAIGIDYGRFPLTRVYTFGLNVDF